MSFCCRQSRRHRRRSPARCGPPSKVRPTSRPALKSHSRYAARENRGPLTFEKEKRQETGISSDCKHLHCSVKECPVETEGPRRQVSTSCYRKRPLPVLTIGAKQYEHPLRLSEQHAIVSRRWVELSPIVRSSSSFGHLLITPGGLNVSCGDAKPRVRGEQHVTRMFFCSLFRRDLLADKDL